MKFNITFSTTPVMGKATHNQCNIRWREESVTIEEFVDKIRAGYLYSNCTYKPFDIAHPEKGYITRINSKAGNNAPCSHLGMNRKYIAYWYMYSFSIVTFDIDKSKYDPEIVYERLLEKPTLIYTTHSDRPGSRCFRMLYFFETPGYAYDVRPIRSKFDRKWHWKSAAKNAGHHYRDAYVGLRQLILYNIPDLEIDPQSCVAVQTYNGNSSENFRVFGDYSMLMPADRQWFPKEPINNYTSKFYIEKIKTPREKRRERIRRAVKITTGRYRKYVFEQITGDNLSQDATSRTKFREELRIKYLFGAEPLNIRLPYVFNGLRALYNDQKAYETAISGVQFFGEVLRFNDEEFEACSEIPKIFRNLDMGTEVTLIYPMFLSEFMTYQMVELFYWYKDLYPNVWQNYSLDYSSPFTYPNDYKTIYNTLQWQFNPLKTHNTMMKMNDGDRRKFHITALAVGRKILTPEIAFDNLLFNAMVDTMFLTCDYNKGTHNRSGNVISKEKIIGCVGRAWRLKPSDKLYKKIDEFISVHPKTHLMYDKVTAMTNARKEKALQTEQKIVELYNPELTYQNNLTVFAEKGLQVSLATLKRACKRLGLSKRASINNN